MSTNEIYEEIDAAQLAEMREWLVDLQFDDLSAEEVAELPRKDVIEGVDRLYEGGIPQFLRAIA